jgi:hypothetical protein
LEFIKMAQSLQDFLKNKGVGTSIVKPIQLPTAKTTVGVADVVKEMPGAGLKTLRWIGKQLMKPVSTISALVEQTGKAIGTTNLQPLAEVPKKVADIVTGKTERSFSDIWRENLPQHKTAGTIIGTVIDIAADPLNFVGGITTKGLELAESGIKKIPIVNKGLKTAFSTTTDSKVFNAFIDEMKSLGEYRKVQVLEGARNVQKVISKLPEKDIIKVSNYIESGIKSTPEINALGEKLKNTYSTWKSLEKEMGIKGGEVLQYVPHIKAKETLAEGIKKLIFPSRQWTTKLGGSEKGRQILKFISDEGTELVGKMENLGLKETAKGIVDNTGKIYQATQASIDEIANAFGKHFFEENPAIQMAYRGLGHAKAITSKEFFNGVRQFATKEGIEVAIPELKGLKFTEDIAKQVDSYYKAIQPEELKVLFRTYDAVLNWWKGQALIAPSYHIRNVVGNIWNNFLAGVKNPISYIQAGLLQSGKAKDFKIAGMGGEELLQLAKKRGVLGEGWYAADIPTAIESGIKTTWKKGINPLSQQNYVFRLNKTVGSAFENNARLAHFIDKLKSGSTIDDAVMSVKKFLFDYQDLTTFEKTVMKRVFPFYTWSRKNIPLQLENLIKQPGKYAGLEKAIKGIENLAMGEAKPANEKYLSDYIKNNTAMRVGYNSDNKAYSYFLLGNWIPSYQALDFLSEPVYNIMAMLTPLIKTPIELLANKSSFFRNTLEEYQSIENYPGETTNFLGINMPKKTATILMNIRILNELDKLNPGAIFGGKQGEPSAWKKLGLPAVKTPVGTLSPATYKYGKTSVQPTPTERAAGTLVGKLQQYKESTAREYYQQDTDRRVQELKTAIKSAARKGDKERVRVLNDELKDFLKKRGR